MELVALLNVLRRRWLLILIPTVIAAAVAIPALVASLRPAPLYQAVIRFSASQIPTEENTTDFQDKAYIPWLGSEYAIVNLATWTTTNSFAHEVSAALTTQQLQIAPDAIQAAIRTDPARSVMAMTIQYPNRDDLTQIASAAILVLQTKNADYFAQLNALPARITPLDQIDIVSVSPPITTRIAPLFRILIGLAAGIALAFLAEYLDRAIRARSDVERFGWKVIGEIPH